MANVLKSQEDLKFPAEFEGAPCHLMARDKQPATKPVTVEAVGYHLDGNEVVDPPIAAEVVWFDVDGDLTKAQSVIDGAVADELREKLKLRLSEAPSPAAVAAAQNVLDAHKAAEAHSKAAGKPAPANSETPIRARARQ